MSQSQPTMSLQNASGKAKGFTLLEVICSLGILSIICSSALVIMARNKQSSYNVTMRLRALEVARENLEQILVKKSVEEKTEYGDSETYPGIKWESTVETFYAPLEGQTWARAVSIARYKDMEDNDEEIELEHWLCQVSESDMAALDQLGGADSGLLMSIEEAVLFAGVDEQEVLMWIENGMVQTEEGFFIEANLKLFQRTNGNPSAEELDQQATTGVFDDMSGLDVEVDLEPMTDSEPGTLDRRGGR